MPIPALANFYKYNAVGQIIAKWLSYPVGVTFSLLGFIACVGISYKLAQYYKLDEISSTILGVLAFLLVTPFHNGIPLPSMGSGGLFVAIIMSLLAIEIVNFIVKKNMILSMYKIFIAKIMQRSSK